MPTWPGWNSPTGTVVDPVWQAVCSPFRNALSSGERRIASAGDSRLARGVSRRAGALGRGEAARGGVALEAGADLRQPVRHPRHRRRSHRSANREDGARRLAHAPDRDVARASAPVPEARTLKRLGESACEGAATVPAGPFDSETRVARRKWECRATTRGLDRIEARQRFFRRCCSLPWPPLCSPRRALRLLTQRAASSPPRGHRRPTPATSPPERSAATRSGSGTASLPPRPERVHHPHGDGHRRRRHGRPGPDLPPDAAPHRLRQPEPPGQHLRRARATWASTAGRTSAVPCSRSASTPRAKSGPS